LAALASPWLGSVALPAVLVVGVGGVGRDPVVGAGRGGGGAAGGFIAAVGGHRHGAVAGDRGALAFLVVVERPADRAARLCAEQAGQRGLLLDCRDGPAPGPVLS